MIGQAGWAHEKAPGLKVGTVQGAHCMYCTVLGLTRLGLSHLTRLGLSEVIKRLATHIVRIQVAESDVHGCIHFTSAIIHFDQQCLSACVNSCSDRQFDHTLQ